MSVTYIIVYIRTNRGKFELWLRHFRRQLLFTIIPQHIKSAFRLLSAFGKSLEASEATSESHSSSGDSAIN